MFNLIIFVVLFSRVCLAAVAFFQLQCLGHFETAQEQ